jgi:hypothetical protein
MIDIYDPEYAMPGELLTTAYDLRTGPERLHAQADDHQRRIAELEQRIGQSERNLASVLGLLAQLVEYRNAESSADSL